MFVKRAFASVCRANVRCAVSFALRATCVDARFVLRATRHNHQFALRATCKDHHFALRANRCEAHFVLRGMCVVGSIVMYLGQISLGSPHRHGSAAQGI